MSPFRPVGLQKWKPVFVMLYICDLRIMSEVGCPIFWPVKMFTRQKICNPTNVTCGITKIKTCICNPPGGSFFKNPTIDNPRGQATEWWESYVFWKLCVFSSTSQRIFFLCVILFFLCVWEIFHFFSFLFHSQWIFFSWVYVISKRCIRKQIQMFNT